MARQRDSVTGQGAREWQGYTTVVQGCARGRGYAWRTRSHGSNGFRAACYIHRYHQQPCKLQPAQPPLHASASQRGGGGGGGSRRAANCHVAHRSPRPATCLLLIPLCASLGLCTQRPSPAAPGGSPPALAARLLTPGQQRDRQHERHGGGEGAARGGDRCALTAGLASLLGLRPRSTPEHARIGRRPAFQGPAAPEAHPRAAGTPGLAPCRCHDAWIDRPPASRRSPAAVLGGRRRRQPSLRRTRPCSSHLAPSGAGLQDHQPDGDVHPAGGG